MFEDHHVTLVSNVKEPAENIPALFETRLPSTMELAGDWEVALIGYSYTHNWLNVKEILKCAIFSELGANETPGGYEARDSKLKEISKTVHSLRPPGYRIYQPEPSELAGVLPVTHRESNKEQIRGEFEIYPGNYTIEEILDIVWDHVKTLFPTDFIQLKYNVSERKIEVKSVKRFALVCPSSPSLLDLLGFKSNTSELPISSTDANKGKYHICRFSTFENKRANESPKLPASIKHLYVYSDILSHSIIGNSKAPSLRKVFVRKKYLEADDWEPLIPHYKPVKHNTISSITIKTCTDTGELVPFVGTADTVTCDLHFRKRGYYH